MYIPCGFYWQQLLEQRKLTDAEVLAAESHDPSNPPEKPRRRKKHFKLVK